MRLNSFVGPMMKTPTKLIPVCAALILCASPAVAQSYDDYGNRSGYAQAASPAAAAQLDQRVDQLEAQVRELTGNLERVQYQNAQLKNQLERFSSDTDLRFQEIKQSPPPAPAPAPQPAPVVDNSVSDHAAAVAPANPKAAKNAPQSPEAAQATYDDAFNKLRAADYAGAQAGFQAFLKSNPDNKLAGNAQYWLGETFYGRGIYKDAAVAFAEGYQKYPKNSKAPDNLLKLALSLGQLGSKDDACLTLGELKKNYPNAAPTIKSRGDQERTRLGCKG